LAKGPETVDKEPADVMAFPPLFVNCPAVVVANDVFELAELPAVAKPG
jgi:hypothetical protein